MPSHFEDQVAFRAAADATKLEGYVQELFE